MAGCEEDLMSMEMGAKIYFDSFFSQRKAPLKNCDSSTDSKTKNIGVDVPGSHGILQCPN